MKQLTIGALMIATTAIIVLCGSARADETNNALMYRQPRAIGIYRPVDFSMIDGHQFTMMHLT